MALCCVSDTLLWWDFVLFVTGSGPMLYTGTCTGPGPYRSGAQPPEAVPVCPSQSRDTQQGCRGRGRPTRLEIRLTGFSRPAPRHGMMSWELPLSEMKGMRRSSAGTRQPSWGTARERAADPAAQPRPGKLALQSWGRTTWPTFNKRTGR